MVEIEAYARLFSIPDPERFAELVIAADEAVWEAKKETQAAKDRLTNKKG